MFRFKKQCLQIYCKNRRINKPVGPSIRHDLLKQESPMKRSHLRCKRFATFLYRPYGEKVLMAGDEKNLGENHMYFPNWFVFFWDLSTFSVVDRGEQSSCDLILVQGSVFCSCRHLNCSNMNKSFQLAEESAVFLDLWQVFIKKSPFHIRDTPHQLRWFHSSIIRSIFSYLPQAWSPKGMVMLRRRKEEALPGAMDQHGTAWTSFFGVVMSGSYIWRLWEVSPVVEVSFLLVPPQN